jgi:hypothetical protein
MSCAACQATFDALDAPIDPAHECRVLQIDRAHPNCRCQDFSVSKHSIGRVDDDEVVARILVAPQHMDKKGRPRAGALSDAERNGLSLFRENHAKDHEIRRVAEGLVARARQSQGDKAGVFGVLLMQCGIIRAFQREGESPCYCLYDTALVDSPGHAEVFQRVADVELPICEDRRRLLFGLVKNTFVPVADFRDGLLLDLAPRI